MCDSCEGQKIALGRGLNNQSLLPPMPNKASKLVNKLNTETNKLTVAIT
jgi:hypothetical protein